MACDLQTSQVQAYIYEVPNGQFSNYTNLTMNYTYDSYGRVTQEVATSNDGGTPGSPTTIVTNTVYVWDDNINKQQYSATTFANTKSNSDAKTGPNITTIFSSSWSTNLYCMRSSRWRNL
jgi:hypothetical protein